MSVRVCAILFAVLIGLASAAKLNKPAVKKGECVDNTLYAKFVCINRKDGDRLLVPGSCSDYYECSNGLSKKKSCSKFYDPELQKCVSKSECVEVDNTDCVIPTPPPCGVTPSPPTTPEPCECPTTPPPLTCPPISCPTAPTCPPPTECPEPIECPAPPTCPSTEPPTEPPTKPPTKPPTEPPTKPPTEPPTNPPTEPPTKPPTKPPTEPPTKPPTKPPTEPPTKPPTKPPTEPPTKPPTKPPTEPPTKPPTKPPTEPPTQPPTEPPTEPPTKLPCPSPGPGPCNSYFNPDDLYGTYACKHQKNGTMMIYPTNCSKYLFCIGGWSYLKSCGSELYFNPMIGACDQKSNVYCPSG